MALTRMVVVGDKVINHKGKVSTIAEIDGNVVYTDEVFSNGKPNMFIARFDNNGRGVITFNKNMTLANTGETL